MPTRMENESPIQLATNHHVREAVARKIDECPHRFVFKNVSWRYEQSQLTLLGCVPSFYLKQVLQELMQGIGQVEQIVNQVDVISSTGLSSEPPNKPR